MLLVAVGGARGEARVGVGELVREEFNLWKSHQGSHLRLFRMPLVTSGYLSRVMRESRHLLLELEHLRLELRDELLLRVELDHGPVADRSYEMHTTRMGSPYFALSTTGRLWLAPAEHA